MVTTEPTKTDVMRLMWDLALAVFVTSCIVLHLSTGNWWLVAFSAGWSFYTWREAGKTINRMISEFEARLKFKP